MVLHVDKILHITYMTVIKDEIFELNYYCRIISTHVFVTKILFYLERV